ncbi:MAG: hypothetical protein PHS14_03225 [Elusimicrobia bacterium]|nr:hypothetical protein [Elusimicrobiota bacterium]
MSRLAAALAVLVSLTASAAQAPKPKAAIARTAGKIIKAQSKLAPGSDGPEFREGRVTIFDKADHTEEFKVTPKTKVTLDGRPAKFQKAAVIGALVLKGLYDPNTKALASLDLKSGPKLDADDSLHGGTVHGEITNTDVIKGVLSIRAADKSMREFIVPETAKIIREAEGKPAEEIRIEALSVGDAVEVHSADGKTALEIHARAAR